MIRSAAEAGVELVVDAHAEVGEGPVWDAERRVLWWVDIPAGLVHVFDPRTGGDRAISVHSPVGAIALRRDGTLLAALAERLAVLDPETGRLETLLPFTDDGPPLRCNDGKCDPTGRFWIGRMDVHGEAAVGSLLRVEPDLSVAACLTQLTVPNGLAWSPDGLTMYYVDSAWCEVRAYAFDAETGAIDDGRPLVRFPHDGTAPDGLTVDEEGCVWVARWGAGCVDRVSPAGDIVARIDVPGVSQVSSCSFGGTDLVELYITTAHEDFTPEDLAREPLAGGLFRCRPGVRGLAPTPVAF